MYLWAQGTDCDVAIRRNICNEMGLRFGVKHTNFRDHRTFYLEMARCFIQDGEEFTTDKAYALTDERETDLVLYGLNNGATHSPIYDCKRSILSTWKMMGMVRNKFNFYLSKTE